MSQEQIPDDFDWVGAQAKCSAPLMFERLRTRVREDVQRRNSLFGRPDGLKFEFHEDEGQFEVSRIVASGSGPTRISAVVRFEHAGRRIHVHSLTGACRFVVGEAIYSDWEIRRMALEQLFFDEDETE